MRLRAPWAAQQRLRFATSPALYGALTLRIKFRLRSKRRSAVALLDTAFPLEVESLRRDSIYA